MATPTKNKLAPKTVMVIVTFCGELNYIEAISSLLDLTKSNWAVGTTKSCYGFVGNGIKLEKSELREKLKELGREYPDLDLGVTLFSNTKESETKTVAVSMRLKNGKVMEEVNAHWEHEVNPFNTKQENKRS